MANVLAVFKQNIELRERSPHGFSWFLGFDSKTVQRSALCRSRRELSNAYLLAKFGFDTAENEPCKVGLASSCVSHPALAGVLGPGGQGAVALRRPRRCAERLPRLQPRCTCNSHSGKTLAKICYQGRHSFHLQAVHMSRAFLV